MLLPQTSSNYISSLCLHNRLLPVATSLRPQLGLIRRSRSHRQTRAFRIGLWFSYLDPDFQKEVQRRQRTMRRKYVEAVNRRLTWDRQTPHVNQRGTKGFMYSAWNEIDRRPSGRWVNMDDIESLNKPTKNTDGTFQAVTQTPVDTLLKTHNNLIQEIIRRKARLFGPSWYESKFQTPCDSKSVRPSTQSSSTPSNAATENGKQQLNTSLDSEVEYKIDPITNRKVYKNTPASPSEVLRKAIKISNSVSQTIISQLQNVNPFASDPARESLKEYEKKRNEKYNPVYYKEPDGKDPLGPCTVMEGLKTYDDKTSYGPVYYKEPDGKDPIQLCSVQKGLSEYDSKVSYGPVYYKEPDGKDPEKLCSVRQGLEDFDARTSYGPVYYNEPDGKAPEKVCSVQAGLLEYDNKVTYGPLMFREPDGKLPEKPCSVKNGLSDFDAKANYGSLTSSNLTTSQKIRRPPPEERVEDLDLLRASDVRAASGISKGHKKESSLEKASKRLQLEEDFKASRQRFIENLELEHSELSNHVAHARGKVNAKITEVEAGWPKSAQTSKLTGNFVRDFPEEFATTWSSAQSDSGALFPNNADQLQQNTGKFDEPSQTAGRDVATSTISTATAEKGAGIERIQPALDRGNAPDEKLVKLASSTSNVIEEQSKRNLERQKHKELVQDIRKIYEDKYGIIDRNHRHKTESKPLSNTTPLTSQSELPTVYKVLAYDPTMQSISKAETTSIVTDSASPLTPAEVLLRLSNPAKFFPHFAPLQAQGYEIVTGGGDVLVFRKVRDGAPVPEAEPSFTTREYRRRRLNPIDGMQPIAATGNFASPTGFVNHDLPHEEPEPTEVEPPFKSNIDVRREEAVFSGKRKWQHSKKSQSGRGKKILLGAFWVGACSYALGVMAEFFKTGGSDGIGPKGF